MPLTHQLLPRAGIDPIDGSGPALAMFDVLIDRPFREQTVALLLDRARRGLGVLVVDGTCRPDSVVEVATLLAHASPVNPAMGAVVLASVRTAAEACAPPDCTGDVDRWMDSRDVLRSAGVDLLEWFVIADGHAWCPRDLLGEPPRW